MIIASEFWLSSPWLLVMLLESPSLRQPDGGHCWQDWRTDAKKCSVYSLIAVVKLNKFWSTLRVVPYLWEILAPPPKGYSPMTCVDLHKMVEHFSSEYEIGLYFDQWHYVKSPYLLYYWVSPCRVSILKPIDFNRFWYPLSRKVASHLWFINMELCVRSQWLMWTTITLRVYNANTLLI